MENIKNDPEPTFEDMYDDIEDGDPPIRGVELELSRNYFWVREKLFNSYLYKFQFKFQ